MSEEQKWELVDGQWERVWSLAEIGEESEAQFVANIIRFREQKDMTQGGLSNMLRYSGLTGMHQTTLSRIEKGERALKFHEAAAIAQALGSSIEQMLQPTQHYATLQELYRVHRELGETMSAIAAELDKAEQIMDSAKDAVEAAAKIDPDELPSRERQRLEDTLGSVRMTTRGGIQQFMLIAKDYQGFRRARGDGGTNGEH